jgi:hypothetical protein
MDRRFPLTHPVRPARTVLIGPLNSISKTDGTVYYRTRALQRGRTRRGRDAQEEYERITRRTAWEQLPVAGMGPHWLLAAALFGIGSSAPSRILNCGDDGLVVWVLGAGKHQ